MIIDAMPLKQIKLFPRQAEGIVIWLSKHLRDYQKIDSHFMYDRNDELEKLTGRKIKNHKERKLAWRNFLMDSEIYLSYCPFCDQPNGSIEIYENRIKNSALFFRERINRQFGPIWLKNQKNACRVKRQPLPSYLKNSSTPKHSSINREIRIPLISEKVILRRKDKNAVDIWVYAIQDTGIMVLQCFIEGYLNSINSMEYDIKFNIQGVTIVLAEDEEIKNNEVKRIKKLYEMEELIKFHNYSSLLFQKYFFRQSENLIDQIIDHKETIKLNEKDKMLLGLYMSIFHRYWNVHENISFAVGKVETKIKSDGGRIGNLVSSPYQNLPYWFIDFFNSLPDEDQKFLKNLDSNKLNMLDIKKIVRMLNAFVSIG